MSKSDKPSTKAFKVPARYYQRMLDLLEERKVDVKQIATDAAIDWQAMTEADAVLSLDQVESVVAKALAVCEQPGLALDLGRRIKPTSHSFVGFALLSSPNIDYALRLLARYFSLIMPSFRLRYGRHQDGRLMLEFMPQISMSQLCLDFHIETIASAVHWEIKELVSGQMPGYELLLSIEKPAHHARYAELKEVHCRFASLRSPGLTLLLPPSLAAQPLAMADSTALQMAESRCRALVNQAVTKQRVHEWIEMMLRESHDSMPSLNELAQTLNLSTRTLNRHLQREGVGFRALCNRVLVEKSQAMLREGHLSITQIAHELG
ncbi:MAG: AraC family transcriptional regulator ligand-binding domain-containing protein, partial [Nevskiales bacterium]